MADDLGDPRRLYDEDILAWSEQQAAALRAREAGANALDYDNLAEEIEDLGKSELRGALSAVENILEHLVKIEFVRSPKTVPHWRGEIRNFRRDLGRRLTRSIENRVAPELEAVFEDVLKELIDRELLTPEEAAQARSQGYAWEQITDPDFYPEPRSV